MSFKRAIARAHRLGEEDTVTVSEDRIPLIEVGLWWANQFVEATGDESHPDLEGKKLYVVAIDRDTGVTTIRQSVSKTVPQDRPLPRSWSERT